MARDISARIHKGLLYRFSVNCRAFMKSRLNAVPFRYGLASPGVVPGRKGQPMKRKGNKKKASKLVLPRYAYPIFVPIEDWDEASIRYYKGCGVPVARFALPGCGRHYYAILAGRTQAEADALNRQMGNWMRQMARDNARRAEHEVSYDSMAEDGYDAAKEDANPEDILMNLAVIGALYEELARLTEEGRRICRMVADKESECAVAEEMGVKRTTMRDHKKRILVGLADRLGGYR